MALINPMTDTTNRPYSDLLDIPVSEYTDSELVMMITRNPYDNALYDELWKRSEIDLEPYYDNSVGVFLADTAANTAARWLGYELNL